MKFSHKKLMKILYENSIPSTERPHGKNCRYFHAQGDTHYAEWYVYNVGHPFHMEDEAHSVCLHTNGTKDDMMTDYFCGEFPKTYKEFIRLLKQKEKEE